MDNVASTFPLLRLPIDAMLNTFIIMNHQQIYGISILSNKTKNLVESLKITADMFHVEVTDTFEIDLYFAPYYSRLHFTLYHILEDEPLQELDTPENVQIRYHNPGVTWSNSISVKELLDHFKFIFHNSITSLTFGENCERFSLESVYKTVKDFRIMCILSGNHEHNKRVLSLFQPASITLVGRARVNRSVPKDILIGNFNVVHVPSVRITLDELVTTNSRVINLGCNSFSVKTLNQFLRLWIKGSNPRLEWMFLRFLGDIEEEELLKELKYKDAPPKRLFKNTAQNKIEEVRDGWDITRFDGRKATITVYAVHSVVFKLFVWHDHCIVE